MNKSKTELPFMEAKVKKRMNSSSPLKSQKSKIKGFTLVELLVAVAVFSIIGGITSGLLISTVRIQRKSLSHQELLSQTSYLIEYMGRAMRMAKKDMTGSCTGVPKINYLKTSTRILGGATYSGPGLKFLNYDNICQEFFLDTLDNKLKESKNNQTPLDLTSSALKVNSFNIGSDDSWEQEDDEQPRITLFFEIEGKERTKIKIQTTISQRNPDIEK